MNPDAALRPVPSFSARTALDPPIGPSPPVASSAAGASVVAVRLPAMAQVTSPRSTRGLSIAGPRWLGGVLAGIAGLWALIVATQLARFDSILETRSVAGIPQHVLLTMAVTVLAFAYDGVHLVTLAIRPKVLLCILCLGVMAGVGITRSGGSLVGVFTDLYTVRWFVVGFMLMRVALVSGNVRSFLTIAVVIILATSLRIDARNSQGGQFDAATSRMTSPDLWPVMNLGTIMAGLLITVTWPHGPGRVVFCVLSFAILILLGGIRSSTRSLFFFQAVCFLLCLFALSRDPRMVGRGRVVRQILAVSLLLLSAVAAYLVVKGQILGTMTQLGSRFAEEDYGRRSTWSYRLREAQEFLQFLQPEDWLVGLGLGVGYWNPLGKGFWATIPHIAVLGWLMKGGIVVLCVMLWSLYVYPAIAFFRATAVRRRDTALPPPILIVGPPLLAWASLTFVSGGIDPGSFLGLGVLSALWAQLADDERRFLRTGAAWVRPVYHQVTA